MERIFSHPWSWANGFSARRSNWLLSRYDSRCHSTMGFSNKWYRVSVGLASTVARCGLVIRVRAAMYT